MKLCDIQEKFPIDEYCYFEPDVNLGGDRYFYTVLGSQFQDRCPADVFKRAVEQKWGSYGERARLAKENAGLDWKALHHALRCCKQVEEIVLTGDLQYPLKDAKLLLQVKKGELDFLTVVQPMLEEYVDKVGEMLTSSNLPEKVDTTFWDNWYVYVISKQTVI